MGKIGKVLAALGLVGLIALVFLAVVFIVGAPLTPFVVGALSYLVFVALIVAPFIVFVWWGDL